MKETRVRSLGWEDPLGEEMATHSSILAQRIPKTVEPGDLQSMGSQRVGHDWATAHAYPLKINSPFLFPSSPWQPPFYCLCLWFWLFYFMQVEPYNISLFMAGLCHLAKSFSGFIHFVTYVRILLTLLFKDCIIFLCIYIPHFIYPFFCEWMLVLFHILSIVNDASMNLGL